MRIVVILVSLCLSTLLAECAVRTALGNPYDSELGDWMLRVRMHHAGKDSPVDRRVLDPDDPVARMRTDARGYLLPSRRFDAPDATVAFLGGSTTECAALDEEQRWPAQVSQLLEAQGLRVDVLNAGRSGNTTHDAVNVLFNHVARDAPDVAVLMEAANDFGVLARDPVYASRSDAPLDVSVPLRWLVQSASRHSALVAALRLRAGTVAAAQEREAGRGARLEASPQEYERRLRAFVGVSRAFGIEPVLMTQPFADTQTPLTPQWANRQAQARFNDALRGVARDEDVLLIDLVEHVARTVPDFREPNRVFYDSIHVNVPGARIYAEHVAARLLESSETLRARRAR